MPDLQCIRDAWYFLRGRLSNPVRWAQLVIVTAVVSAVWTAAFGGPQSRFWQIAHLAEVAVWALVALVFLTKWRAERFHREVLWTHANALRECPAGQRVCYECAFTGHPIDVLRHEATVHGL